MKPLKDSDRYKFQMIQVKFRWVDYCRIRHTFPAEQGESAASYFRRLAKWLQTQNSKL